MWNKLDFAITYASKIRSVRVGETLRDATRRKVSAVSGYIEAPVGSNEVYFESSVERDFLLACRLDKQIIKVVSQPFTLSFHTDDNPKTVSYTPDYLIEKDFSKQPGQFCIGSPDKRFSLFEVKREADLERQGYDAILRIASGYQWAQETDNRTFSVLTDSELVGDFGTYMRLLSNFIESPLNETTAEIIDIYQKQPNSLVGDVIEALVSKNITETEIFNGIWILIAKSILQPTKLGDLNRQDKLTYVKPR